MRRREKNIATRGTLDASDTSDDDKMKNRYIISIIGIWMGQLQKTILYIA